MENGANTSSRTRALAWIAATLFVGGLLLPFAVFGVLVSLGHNPGTSAATISLAVGLGFASLLVFVLALIGWRHAIGKVTAIGTVALAIAAAVVLLRSGPELDGTWKGILMEYPLEGGVYRVNLEGRVYRLTIAGDKFHVKSDLFNTDDGMPSEMEGDFFYDATAHPKTYEALGKGTNVKASINWSGTYELDGDTLTLDGIPRSAGNAKVILRRINK